MTVHAFLAAMIALALAHGVRLPRGSGLGLLAAALAGFAITVLAVRIAADTSGLDRRTDYDRVLLHALEQVDADARPYVLFLGASFSRNALDPAVVETRLARNGLDDLKVINLSMQGASLQERHARLHDFLEAAPRLPEMVFLEIGEEFDRDPHYVFQTGKLTDRAIAQFGPRNTLSAIRLGLGDACGGGISCLKSLGLSGLHAGANLANLGLLSAGKRLDDASPLPAYDPQASPRAEVATGARRSGLSTALTPHTPGAPNWARAERQRVIDGMAARGIPRVALYAPPVIDAQARAYVRGVCTADHPALPCIAGDDRQLLTALDRDVWFDDSHLLAPGAEIYSLWLGDQLVQLFGPYRIDQEDIRTASGAGKGAP